MEGDDAQWNVALHFHFHTNLRSWVKMAESEIAANSNPKRMKIGRKVVPYLYVLPVLLIIAIFAIYPIFHAVRMSFFK